ncbi:excisionase [Agathobacter rectalis]|uniref:excisionase n=1 Tax=Agathobacter rectalis TaxID=39491 RepID=UPI003A89D800
MTLEEASAYFGIGQNKLRELTNSDSCPYVIWCGNKRLIKRKLFLEYSEKMYSI